MSGKLPIDRVREHERNNQSKKERAKQRVTQDQAAVEQRARAHDDEAATRALEAGETPPGADTEDSWIKPRRDWLMRLKAVGRYLRQERKPGPKPRSKR